MRRRTVVCDHPVAAARSRCVVRPSSSSAASRAVSSAAIRPGASGWIPGLRGRCGLERCDLVLGQRAGLVDQAEHPTEVRVQYALRGDPGDPAAARQGVQQQVAVFVAGPGPDHARDLGATGGQADPGRVRPPGQRLGHRRRGVRRALHPDQPGRQSDQVRLDQPAHAQLPRGPEPVVPPRDGLIGHPEHLADQAERGPAVELQRVDELNIQSVRHGISPSIPSPVSISAGYFP